MKYFLLVYDRRQGEIIDQQEYELAEIGRAVAERNRRLVGRVDPEIEVVLLGADSIDDLKKTHARYFTRELEQIASDKLEKIGSV